MNKEELMKKYPFIKGLYFYSNGFVKAQFKNGKDMIRPDMDTLEKSIEFHKEELL